MSSCNREGIVGFHTSLFVSISDGRWMFDKFTIKGITDCNFDIGILRELESPNRCEVSVKKSNSTSVFAQITVSIHGEDITRIIHNWTDVCTFIKVREGYPSLLDAIKIDCRIIWYGTTEDAMPLQASLSPFSGFYNFHSNSSLSDLQISIGGGELSAHKVILAAHSPVFLSMFETDMKEKREGRIVIEGIELNVMKIVLSILYTGYDKDLDELGMAEKVLIVAERYKMKALKRLCEWKIFHEVNVWNVLDMLDKADKYNAGILQTGCLNFIVRNRKEVFDKLKDLKTISRNNFNAMCELLQTFTITL